MYNFSSTFIKRWPIYRETEFFLSNMNLLIFIKSFRRKNKSNISCLFKLELHSDEFLFHKCIYKEHKTKPFKYWHLMRIVRYGKEFHF